MSLEVWGACICPSCLSGGMGEKERGSWGFFGEKACYSRC